MGGQQSTARADDLNGPDRSRRRASVVRHTQEITPLAMKGNATTTGVRVRATRAARVTVARDDRRLWAQLCIALVRLLPLIGEVTGPNGRPYSIR